MGSYLTPRNRLRRSLGLAGGLLLTAAGLAVADSAHRVAPPPHLSQPAGEAGCFRTDGQEGCTRSDSIDRPTRIAVSRDGRSIYVGSALSLTAFARGSDGRLREIGCFRDRLESRARFSRCLPLPDLAPADIAVTRDGRNVYVASSLDDPSGAYFARVIAFRRDPTSGQLTPTSCVGAPQDGAARGCTRVRGLDSPWSLAIAPDDRYIYVSGGSALDVFSRNSADGSLRQLPGSRGCLLAPASQSGCAHRANNETFTGETAITPDGRKLFILEDLKDSSDNPANALLVFARDARRGTLNPLGGMNGCVVAAGYALGTCSSGSGLNGVHWEFSLAVSANSRDLYVGNTLTIATFSILESGLRQLASDNGCVDLAPRNSGSGCKHASGVEPFTSLALSRNGRVLYFAYTFGPNGQRGRLLELARRPRTGVLSTVAKECYSGRPPAAGCEAFRGLHGPTAIATTQDGASLYAAGFVQSGTYNGDISELAVLAMPQ